MTKPIHGLTLLIAVTALAGCAGTPKKEATASADTVQHPEIKGPVSGQSLVALQHAGYTLVNKNGQVLYCENDPKTGTRIARDPVCLTEAQLREVRERSQQAVSELSRMIPPPQGK